MVLNSGLSMASLVSRYGWQEWLCKTNFSFLIGASHPQELVERATQLNYRSLAVSDFDGVYGLARTHLMNERVKKNFSRSPLKIRFGAEVHLRKDHGQPVLLQDTLCLLALNKQGYAHLCRLLSQSHRSSKSEGVLSLEQILKADVTGLVAIQPMRGKMRIPLSSGELQSYENLRDHFRGDFYLALSRHLHPSEDSAAKKVLQLHKARGFKTLCCQDVFMHEPGRKPLSDVLQAIRLNKTLEQSQGYFFPNGERHLHSLAAIEKLFSPFSVFEQSLKNSCALEERFDFDLSELRYYYPKEMLPRGFSAQAYLEKLTWEGADGRYKNQVPAAVKKSLEHELKLIAHLGFADYFLTIWDIVGWARKQKILCQGRGSAANSAVCFVLGITAVDPGKFDLLFERFMSKERGDPPDIDVDFEHERREEVVQYIYERYGRHRAAMVANVVTFRGRGALRFTGKALGIAEEVLSRTSHLRGTKFYRGSGAEHLLSQTKLELGEIKPNQDSIPWELWANLSEQIKGFPRHLSIHSGGFVISSQPLNHLVAQEPATMPGRTVVQWCKEDIEGLGFFKIDVLSLGMLTAIRKCFVLVEEHYGQSLSLYGLPENDPKTYAMIQRADTTGVFQIESRAQMSMLPRLRPRSFYDLVIEVAVIRPGPIQGGVIHPFLRRRHGLEPVTYADPRLEPILRRTLGVPIFQEQAMRIAIAVGDFTPGEANELRKNIGVWNVKEFERNLNPWLEKLHRGMKKNGLSQEFIDLLMGQMKGFAAYGFPESHAVSFAFLAYASSFLKCHYPAAFFTSLLNSQPMGFYPPHALLQAAKKDGVEVLPLCVNRSGWDHQLEGENKALRLGLRLVNGLSETGAKRLLEERQARGEFKDADDFLRRSRLTRPDVTALAAANALKVFGRGRRETLWWGEKVPLSPMVDIVEQEPPWPEESAFERLQSDYSSFNATLGEHPAAIIKKELWQYPIKLDQLKSSKDFKGVRPHHFIYSFGMVLVKQAPPSAKGMVFITLVDEYGSINLAIPPPVYDRYHQWIDGEAFLCVYGKMQKAGEGHSIFVRHVVARDLRAKNYSLPEARDQQKFEKEKVVSLDERRLKRPRSYH